MKAVELGHLEPNTPEWDEIRSRGLGGSEIAAVVGLSPWVSRFALYHRKRGTIGKQEVNTGMDWGTRLEPAIARAFCEQHPEYAPRLGGTYHHAERAWQIGNPDMLLAPACECPDVIHECDLPEPTGLLEVKTAHTYDAHEWGPTGTDEIPPYYRCQVLWYLDVFELPRAHLAVLIGGSDYREYVIEYVAEEAEWLREQGEAFWADVVAERAPGIDGHDATYAAVRELHPEIERGVDAHLDPVTYGEYAVTKAALIDAQTVHNQAKSVLLNQMGEAQYGAVNETRVVRRQPGRGGSVSLYDIPAPKTQEKSA